MNKIYRCSVFELGNRTIKWTKLIILWSHRMKKRIYFDIHHLSLLSDTISDISRWHYRLYTTMVLCDKYLIKLLKAVQLNFGVFRIEKCVLSKRTLHGAKVVCFGFIGFKFMVCKLQANYFEIKFKLSAQTLPKTNSK